MGASGSRPRLPDVHIRLLSRDSWLGQRKVHALSIEFSDCPMDRAVECDWVGEGLMREMMRFEIPPDAFDVVQFGVYFGSHLTVSQWARAASAAKVSLLVWIGPLASTRTTGLVG
jgi:hypothetical protein